MEGGIVSTLHLAMREPAPGQLSFGSLVLLEESYIAVPLRDSPPIEGKGLTSCTKSRTRRLLDSLHEHRLCPVGTVPEVRAVGLEPTILDFCPAVSLYPTHEWVTVEGFCNTLGGSVPQ